MLKSILLLICLIISSPTFANEQTVYTPADINCSSQDDIYYCVTARYRKPITGIVRSYTKSGGLEKEEHYLEGKLNGTQKYYDESGKIEEERSYKKGKLYGVSKGYYPSGKLKFRANFKGSRYNGYIETFDEDGRPIDRIYRTNGREKVVPARRY